MIVNYIKKKVPSLSPHCPHLHDLAHTSQHIHPTEANSQPGKSLYSIDRRHTDDLFTVVDHHFGQKALVQIKYIFQQKCARKSAISSCSFTLLDIHFTVLGFTPMDDLPNILAISSHAKSNCCYDNT